MNKIAIIIPSRLDAQRLPNKPLKLINNKEMILHVYDLAIKSNAGFDLDYGELMDQVKSTLDGNKIFDVTVGVFRMGQDYFNQIRKSNPESKVFYQDYENDNGVITISQSERSVVIKNIKENLMGFISEEKIHFWD